MTTYAYNIDDAESHLAALKSDYLRRWGWYQTCNTPGSYWMWRRDFAQEDAERHENWRTNHPTTREPEPYGVITAGTDTAIQMTIRSLDPQLELSDDE